MNNTTILNQNYKTVIQRYDGKNTIFYLDPPYATEKGNWGYDPIDMKDMFEVLKNIKGKFLMSFENHPETKKMASEAGFKIKYVQTSYFLQGNDKPQTQTKEILI